ncbi:MAG: type II toxin-antitoxin system HicA family toxin [Dehalococcoidia bacterium]
MPQKPKSVSGKRMLRFLQRKGWWIERIHGSHHILHHDEYRNVTIVIAIHGNKAMSPRAIVATLKAASISSEEYNREA